MKRIGLVMIMGVMVLSCQREEGSKPRLYSPMESMAVVHPTFVWESVGDMYHLQVSSDSSFASTVINEEELTDTTYTPEDTLEEARYYWRVRAKLDTWGEWSDVSSFFVVGPAWGLISPPDADTVKFPALVWSSLDEAESYRLFIYQGDTSAGRLVLDADLTDTSYTITDTLDPATYRWSVTAMVGEQEVTYLDTFRFVTYTLDESFFPAGPGYKWEYMLIRYGKPSQGDSWSDTSYYTVAVTDIVWYDDSLCVYFSNSEAPAVYRNDSIFNGHYGYTEGLGTKLFLEKGDSISFWFQYLPLNWTSDTACGYGYQDDWDFGELFWEYECREKGLGRTSFDSGYGHRYHTEPEYSWWEGSKSILLNLDKGE